MEQQLHGEIAQSCAVSMHLGIPAADGYRGIEYRYSSSLPVVAEAFDDYAGAYQYLVWTSIDSTCTYSQFEMYLEYLEYILNWGGPEATNNQPYCGQTRDNTASAALRAVRRATVVHSGVRKDQVVPTSSLCSVCSALRRICRNGQAQLLIAFCGVLDGAWTDSATPEKSALSDRLTQHLGWLGNFSRLRLEAPFEAAGLTCSFSRLVPQSTPQRPCIPGVC